MKTYIILSFLFPVFLFSQSERLSLLDSQGEMPFFLEEIQPSNFFIPEPAESVRGDFKYNRKEHHLYEIYRSGMVTYGDSVSQYCSDLLEKMGFKNQVYCVKNRYPGVFSNSEGSIFITSGLFSQLTNEAELAFFLTRELLANEKGLRQSFGSKNKEEKTLDNIIQKLSSYSFELEQQLDSLAFDFLLKQAPYSKNELAGSFDILLYSGLPFYEVKVDWNYFNSDLVYVPESELLFLFKKKNFDYYKPERYKPNIVSRKKKITAAFGVQPAENPVESYQLNRDYFDQASLLARRDDILNDIIQTHFLEALYEIYALESLGKSSFYLDYLKAQAWLGNLEQKLNLIRQNQYNDYEFSDNEGALFCRFIRSQPVTSLAALTIRKITDIRNKYPEIKSFETLYEECLKLTAKIPGFKIEDFRKETYLAYLKKNGMEVQKIDPSNTDNRKIQFEIQKTDPFYLFVLSDLVSDPGFISRYDSLTRSSYIENKRKTSQLAIKSFYLRSYTIESKAQQLLDQENIDAISSLAQIPLLEEKIKMDATTAYNRKSVFNATIIQSYAHNRYKKTIHPVLSEKLIDADGNKAESFCIGKYENQFKPRVRGIYFTGLFVVPLPYLIPEFFYSGHHSLFASFYFNSKTGQMEGVSYSQFNDPCSKLIFKNVFFRSLRSAYPEKP
ncbi:MAG: hypothetical protein K0R65_2714 [Crocinitomicaceae bacterium]|jgi:hypothetical protein|nr:hypothetical protein [Crocinitomicaceae bacterium]